MKNQELFDHMLNEHGLILTYMEMFEIENIVNKKSVENDTRY